MARKRALSPPPSPPASTRARRSTRASAAAAAAAEEEAASIEVETSKTKQTAVAAVRGRRSTRASTSAATATTSPAKRKGTDAAADDDDEDDDNEDHQPMETEDNDDDAAASSSDDEHEDSESESQAQPTRGRGRGRASGRARGRGGRGARRGGRGGAVRHSESSMLDDIGIDFDPDALADSITEELASISPRASSNRISSNARKHLAEIQHHRRSVIPEDERAKLEEVAYKLSDDEDEASAETEHQHHVIDAASNFVALSASNQDAKIVRKALGSQLTAIHVQLPCLLTRPPDLQSFTAVDENICRIAAPWMVIARTGDIISEQMLRIASFHHDPTIAEQAFGWLYRNMCSAEPVQSSYFIHTSTPTKQFASVDHWVMTFDRFLERLSLFGAEDGYLDYIHMAIDIGFEELDDAYWIERARSTSTSTSSPKSSVPSASSSSSSSSSPEAGQAIVRQNLPWILRLLEAAVHFYPETFSERQRLALLQILARCILDPQLPTCLPATRSAFGAVLRTFGADYQIPESTVAAIVRVIASPWVTRHFYHWLPLVSGLASTNKWQDQILTARVSLAGLLSIVESGPLGEGTRARPWIRTSATLRTQAEETDHARSGPGSFPSFKLICNIVSGLSQTKYHSAVELTFLHVSAALIDRCIDKDVQHYVAAEAKSALQTLANHIGALKTTIQSTVEFDLVAAAASAAVNQVDWLITMLLLPGKSTSYD